MILDQEAREQQKFEDNGGSGGILRLFRKTVEGGYQIARTGGSTRLEIYARLLHFCDSKRSTLCRLRSEPGVVLVLAGKESIDWF